MIYNKIILDSCVFIALYNENDIFHKEAIDIFNFHKNNFILINNYVIQEVSTVLVYKFGKKMADVFIDDISNANNVIIHNGDIFDEMKFFKNINKKISFTDLSLLYLSDKYNSLLITFDKQLLNLYKKSIN